jgi:hypothetical protein
MRAAATTTTAPPVRRAGVPRLFSLALLLGLAALATWMIASQLGGGSPTASASSAAFEEQSGVRIMRVVLTAGGGVIDVRFQVIDPSKAAELHEPNGRLRILDEGSGRRLATPFHFHAGGAEYKAGIVYYELLNNSGGTVDRGDRVSVVIGAARLEHVAVE